MRTRVMTVGVASTVLALVLAACAGSSSVSLTIGSPAVELIRGGSVAVEVSLTGGAGGDVTLAVTGLPVGVAATFAPATLSGATRTSSLTLSAEAAALNGSYPVTVAATGGGQAATAALNLTVMGMTVTGQVLTTASFPATGVAVGSQGVVSVTDADGSFALSDLAIPYDLSVWNTAEQWVHIFEGLTAAEQVVSVLAAEPAQAKVHLVSVTGTFTGGVMPAAPDRHVLACVEGIDGFLFGCTDVIGSSSYALNATWVGEASRIAKLHAIQIETDASGYPVGYPGYSSVPLTLTDGVAASANIDLGDALPTTTVDLDIDAADSILGTYGAVQVTPHMLLSVLKISSAATEHLFVMPVIDDATYTFVGLSSTFAVGWRPGVTADGATLTVPSVPQLVEPAANATGITSTTPFAAVNPTGGPLTFVWAPNSGAVVAVTTMATIHTIPDLDPYELTWPAATMGDWFVYGHSGPDTDHVTNPSADYDTSASLTLGLGSPGFRHEGSLANTALRSFTTAP